MGAKTEAQRVQLSKFFYLQTRIGSLFVRYLAAIAL